jgi:hypothetical protein
MTSPNTSKDKALIVLTAICCAAPFLYICYLVNEINFFVGLNGDNYLRSSEIIFRAKNATIVL